MKAPKTFPMGGFTYRVRQTATLNASCGLIGAHEARRRLIQIDKLQSKESKNECLWHELLHAINNVYCNNTLDERDVDGVANGLYQFMKSIGVEFEF